jgi:myo-inositol-1(or 4)-monophosphatase
MSAGRVDPAELLDLATRAAQKAADLLVAGWSQRSVVSTKTSGTDIVTQMDRGSEALIVQTLLADRPDDALIGEEGGSREGRSRITWVIDPLDGTVNYLYGFPVWAVSIAALVDDVPTVGVVHAPALGRVWTAVAGGAAQVNGEPISASACADPAQALVATGFGYRSDVRAEQGRIVAELLPMVRDIRRAGAAAVDMCWVAEGVVDAYFEHGTHLWDRAAAIVVCEAAGARVGGPDGGPPTDAMTVAANRDLYGPLCEVLRSVGVPS